MIYLGRDKVGLNQLTSVGSSASTSSIVFALDAMTNASGSYTHTTNIQGVTATMKPIMIELSDPSAFLDQITATCDNGSITIYCPNVSGSSQISVTVTDISSSSQTVFGVEDVQINGTSIVSNGTANIPIAGNNTLGVIQIGGYGITRTNEGIIQVQRATEAEIKAGINGNKPIVPYSQDQAIFYGLAKLAGVDMASSANEVGVFTPEAKKAIRQMLGIPNFEVEIIREYTTIEDLASVNINADENNQPFNLRACSIFVKLPASTTGTTDWISASGTATRTDDTQISISFPTVKMALASKSLNMYTFDSYNGMYITTGCASSDYSMSSNGVYRMAQNVMLKSLNSFQIRQYSNTTTLIPSGTIIKIIGIRL